VILLSREIDVLGCRDARLAPLLIDDPAQVDADRLEREPDMADKEELDVTID
jgi:hypothetical protein